jgi:hypothetical protein
VCTETLSCTHSQKKIKVLKKIKIREWEKAYVQISLRILLGFYTRNLPKKGDYKSEREKLVKGGGVCSVLNKERK